MRDVSNNNLYNSFLEYFTSDNAQQLSVCPDDTEAIWNVLEEIISSYNNNDMALQYWNQQHANAFISSFNSHQNGRKTFMYLPFQKSFIFHILMSLYH